MYGRTLSATGRFRIGERGGDRPRLDGATSGRSERGPRQPRQTQETGQLGPGQPEIGSRLRLQLVQRDPKREVGEKETAEDRSVRDPGAPSARRPDRDRYQERDFVQLNRVPPDPVPEVDAPWEGGGNPVRVVGDAAEEAAHAAERNPEAERKNI